MIDFDVRISIILVMHFNYYGDNIMCFYENDHPCANEMSSMVLLTLGAPIFKTLFQTNILHCFFGDLEIFHRIGAHLFRILELILDYSML